jgi:hypothetical protein
VLAVALVYSSSASTIVVFAMPRDPGFKNAYQCKSYKGVDGTYMQCCWRASGDYELQQKHCQECKVNKDGTVSNHAAK